MPRTKKDASPTADGRCATDLDLIRAGVWCWNLLQVGNFNSIYALAKFIEGDISSKKKWSYYKSMEGVPNQDTLDLTESKFSGSSEIFLRGPAGTRLWNALNATSSYDLEVIVSRSEKVDSKIAKLKLDLRIDKIKVTIKGNSSYENDEFVRISTAIQDDLYKIMPSQFGDMIMQKFILDLADHLYVKEDAEFHDFIMCSAHGDIANRKLLMEDDYLEMQMPSIGKKGSGGGPKGK